MSTKKPIHLRDVATAISGSSAVLIDADGPNFHVCGRNCNILAREPSRPPAQPRWPRIETVALALAVAGPGVLLLARSFPPRTQPHPGGSTQQGWVAEGPGGMSERQNPWLGVAAAPELTDRGLHADRHRGPCRGNARTLPAAPSPGSPKGIWGPDVRAARPPSERWDSQAALDTFRSRGPDTERRLAIRARRMGAPRQRSLDGHGRDPPARRRVHVRPANLRDLHRLVGSWTDPVGSPIWAAVNTLPKYVAPTTPFDPW